MKIPLRNSSAHCAFVLFASFVLLGLVGCATKSHQDSKRDSFFAAWPKGAGPTEVGERIAENFLTRKFRYETNPQKASLGIIYPEAITWYGALTFSRLSGQSNLNQRLVQKFEPLLTEPESKRINRSAHVDYRVFGIVPLEIYQQTGNARYRDVALQLARDQWEKVTSDGITAEARYWIDDMYMIPAIQTQAYRATGDSVYLDHAALTMATYLDRLQQTNGLFYHGEAAPFYWGRGNGWMAAGAAELLRSLPRSHAHYDRILRGYQKMMAALLVQQRSDGLWNQLIDHPDSWAETSGSAMFTFAFVTGVKSGWLPEQTYGPAARKAWLALVGQLNADSNLQEVCVGTDKADKVVGSNLEAQLKFYQDRPRTAGDFHGQAPMLWTATALLR